MTPPPDPMEFWGDIYTKALAEENSIDFDSFSHADAWALASIHGSIDGVCVC